MTAKKPAKKPAKAAKAAPAKGKKNLGGAPPHQPTDEQRSLVRELKAAGCTHVYIARRIGVCDDMLGKHYAAEVQDGMEEATAEMARSVYRRGLDGDNACAFFWLKCRAGWREKTPEKEDAPEATPVQVVVTVVDASVPRA